MRTVVIETRNAPKDLVRFTEVRCLFDYENRWTGFFNDVVLQENADHHPRAAWRIRAGQYITSTIRQQNQHLEECDLRHSTATIDYDPEFSFTHRMPQYRGRKQEYIFENYMRMVLKSRKRMLYLSNNDAPPQIQPDFQGDCWLPASGTRAYETWAANPDIRPVIYDINNDQLQFARWLNQQPEYPPEQAMTQWIHSEFHRSAIAEPWQPVATSNWSQWANTHKRYVLRDILATDLEAPTFMTNIGRYLPCYHQWGHSHIRDWHTRNHGLIIR